MAQEDRRAERRALLLDAGFALLGGEGTAATTVRAVCQTARLNPRYFYESFDDLDALIVAVYDRVVAELADAIADAVLAASPSPAAQLHAALLSTIRFVDEDRRRGRVLYVEALGNESLNRRRRDTGRRLVEMVERDAPRVGRAAAAILVGGFGELLAEWLDGEIDVSPEQLADDAARLFLALGAEASRVSGPAKRTTPRPGGRPLRAARPAAR